jgi:uncharacterized integral membrane protein
MSSLARRIFSEWLGTAFLLATVIGSGIMAQRLAGGNGALALLCNTIPTGAILVVLILIFAPLSGAHFNPAVSLAFAWRGELPWPIAARYIAAQIASAILAHLARRRRAMGRRSRRHVRIAADDLRLCRANACGDSLRGRPLHHRGLLVHGLDLVRKPRGYARARGERHVLRDTACGRAGIRRR